MAVKFEKGQKVTVKPSGGGSPFSPRDVSIEPYAGRRGQVTNYYSIVLRDGKAVYLYTVMMDNDRKELVLHEDELEPGIK
jgi:hypothetical protein